METNNRQVNPFADIVGNIAKEDGVVRKTVQGRQLQYDADFACYEVADLDKPVGSNYSNLLKHIEMKKVLAGCNTVVAHVTLGEKSGREAMATIKPYQENRDPDVPIKVRVRELRNMLANAVNLPASMTVHYNMFFEADDEMCKMQEARIAKLGVDSTCIMSGDKDLGMVMGLHCDAKTGRMWTVYGYGKTELREVGNVKPKLVGEGTSWFWHQMIMGDKADNIPGLEKIDNSTLDDYIPLKSGKPRKAGASACGEAKAIILLQDVTDDCQAARRVYNVYSDYYGTLAPERFYEQAYLLWMQRTENVDDVSVYINNECRLPLRPHAPTRSQKLALEKFMYRIKGAQSNPTEET